MIQDLQINGNGRIIVFKMDLDNDFVADRNLLWYLTQGQVPEKEVVSLMMRVVQPGDTVVDAGANIGFFTLLLSRLVGDTGKVIAIEPGENNWTKLNTNIEWSKADNIALVTKPLDACIRRTDFYVRADSGSNSCHGDAKEQPRSVETVTLDELTREMAPRLIKLDIEGSEVKALRGAGTLLRFGRPSFIVCEVNEQALAAMGDDLASLRRTLPTYDLFILHENGQIPSLLPGNSMLKPTRQNANVLFSTLEDVGKAWAEVSI